MNTTRLPCVNILCKVCKDGVNITLMAHRFEIQVERIGKTNSYIYSLYRRDASDYHFISKYVFKLSIWQIELASRRRHYLEEKWVTSDKMHEQNKQNGHLALGIKRFIPADIWRNSRASSTSDPFENQLILREMDAFIWTSSFLFFVKFLSILLYQNFH